MSKFSDLLSPFMLWRTCQTDWFGQPILNLPPHEARDVKCSIDLKYAQNFQDFQAVIQFKLEQDFQHQMQVWKATDSKSTEPTLSVKNLVEVSYKVQICATFPYLLKLLKEGVVD